MGPDSGFLSSGLLHVIIWGGLAALTMLLIFSFLIFLCSSCDSSEPTIQKNSVITENVYLHLYSKGSSSAGRAEKDLDVISQSHLLHRRTPDTKIHPSDKEAFSHSVTSLATDPLASSEQNGGLSSGDVLSEDSTTACIQPYEEVQTSVTDLLDQQDSLGRSLKYHQSRELPRIPPNNAMETMLSTRNTENDHVPAMEGPYEVLKDSSSQENIVEDCLYETVKEIKELGTAANSDKNCNIKPKGTVMVNGSIDHVPERKIESAEYASVDRNKKSRQSANSESPLSHTPDMETETPPPVPVKLLDENENVQEKGAKVEEEVANGPSEPDKRLSSLSYKSREEDPSLTEDEISAMYSSVNKPGQATKQLESTYTCIPEIVPQKSPSICSGLYASVKDLENAPNFVSIPHSSDRLNGELESDYEAIQTLSHEEDRSVLVPNTSQSDLPQENDYESIGDLQQNKDVTRL